MAVRHVVVKECDQHPHDQPNRGEFDTIRFELDGTAYETELCPQHAKSFHSMISAWIEHGRRAAVPLNGHRRPGGRAAGRTAADRAQAREMREWLRVNGRNVAERGRIPEADRAYYREHARSTA
jgi:hypothetical protein